MESATEMAVMAEGDQTPARQPTPGLDRLDRNVLSALVGKFNGGPVGLSTLAIAVGEETETVETTTHHERTTITETHAPGTLRFDEPPEEHNAPEPAPVEPEPEQPAPVESTPAPVSSVSVAPQTTQQAPAPAPGIELPNLENLLGGGR